MDEPQKTDANSRFLHAENLPAAGAFVRSVAWADMKRAMAARAPAWPEAGDAPHVAAAKGFEVKSFMRALDELERLPFERPEIQAPLIPEALVDPRD